MKKYKPEITKVTTHISRININPLAIVKGQKEINLFAKDETFSFSNRAKENLYAKYGTKDIPNKLGISIFNGVFMGKG
jgi:hypothetical protein